jgi:hypothetical protein
VGDPDPHVPQSAAGARISGVLPTDHARQTPYSDPGRWAHLLDGVPATVEGVSAMARNLTAHYRAQAAHLPASSRGDIELRWVEAMLETDQRRRGTPTPLTAPRALGDRLQGCCRDHTLLAVAALRHHGVPARSRVGFAPYLSETDFHHDHVIVEAWLDGRWRRFDPEFDSPRPGLPDPTDVPLGHDGFLSAAQVWTEHRAGTIDVGRFGVAEDLPIGGDWFVHGYVIQEVAHRFGDELLLWDQWGAMTGDLATAPPEHLELVDEVAALLLAADAGDVGAEAELEGRYRSDPRLHPPAQIRSFGPGGAFEVDLSRRTSRPAVG